MKSISTALQQHLQQEVTSLAYCWKLTREDGVALGFTTHDQPISYDGLSYEPASGFDLDSYNSHSNLAEDGVNALGILSSEAITEADILAGRYEGATVELFMLNYEDTTQGTLEIRSGTIKAIEWQDGAFRAELVGLTDTLGNTIGSLYSPTCRAVLGDSRCKVDLTAYTFTGTITAVTSRTRFTDDTLTQQAGYFSHGTVTFTSGLNAGIAMEVRRYAAGGEIQTVLPMPYDVAAGDNFTIVTGCDKLFTTCKNTFDNVVNFRGEPHVPGIDRMLETSSTRSD